MHDAESRKQNAESRKQKQKAESLDRDRERGACSHLLHAPARPDLTVTITIVMNACGRRARDVAGKGGRVAARTERRGRPVAQQQVQTCSDQLGVRGDPLVRHPRPVVDAVPGRQLAVGQGCGCDRPVAAAGGLLLDHRVATDNNPSQGRRNAVEGSGAAFLVTRQRTTEVWGTGSGVGIS